MWLWRWVEEKGERVVLPDRGEVGRWLPSQRQRACGPQTGFQVNSRCFRDFMSGNKTFFLLSSYTSSDHLPAVLLTSLCQLVTSRWWWFSVPQLRRGFWEGEFELPNREGPVPAASVLRMWRYAWPPHSINNSSTICYSGRKDYYSSGP